MPSDARGTPAEAPLASKCATRLHAGEGPTATIRIVARGELMPWACDMLPRGRARGRPARCCGASPPAAGPAGAADKSQRVLRVKSGTAMRDNELRFVASSYIP